MSDILNLWNQELAIRLSCFVGVLMVMGVAELLAPRRSLVADKAVRWTSNLGLVALNTVCLRLVLPLGAVGSALLFQEAGWGLLNNLSLAPWLAVIASVVMLDLVVYLQHVLFHAVPAFWRLHMVHHADPDVDVTTGVRFHTLEILLSMGIKLAAIAVLGPPPAGVLLFEVLLNATSMFSHGNVYLPKPLDRILRLIVVTPDMHRVHHSAATHETNSNFGFNLPWWDFLLGTYRSEPAEGHERMTLGLMQYRDDRVTRLRWMLILPFVPVYVFLAVFVFLSLTVLR
jgi:sterol desaturase/sphingolipid hydroxylase (fatty acid hydroxylase superfamily)